MRLPELTGNRLLWLGMMDYLLGFMALWYVPQLPWFALIILVGGSLTMIAGAMSKWLERHEAGP